MLRDARHHLTKELLAHNQFQTTARCTHLAVGPGHAAAEQVTARNVAILHSGRKRDQDIDAATAGCYSFFY